MSVDNTIGVLRGFWLLNNKQPMSSDIEKMFNDTLDTLGPLIKNDNVHSLDEQMFSNLRNHLKSSDESDKNLAVEILNACDLTDIQTRKWVCEIVSSGEYDITFDVSDKLENGTFKFFTMKQYLEKENYDGF